MQLITQAQFEAFPIVDGFKQCPSGDYSLIKSFGVKCSFDKVCSFGEECRFGEWCSFSKWCSFGEWCSFGKWCSFGERCSFSKECRFGVGCSFGEWCSFGKWCSFGEKCSFGEGCNFGVRCSYNGFSFKKHICLFNLIEYPIYVFLNEQSYLIRAGCQHISNLDEAKGLAKEYKIKEIYINVLKTIITEKQQELNE